jgi:hypothetical protein
MMAVSALTILIVAACWELVRPTSAIFTQLKAELMPTAMLSPMHTASIIFYPY